MDNKDRAIISIHARRRHSKSRTKSIDARKAMIEKAKAAAKAKQA